MTQKRGLGRGLSDLGLNELLSEISNASPPLSMAVLDIQLSMSISAAEPPT